MAARAMNLTASLVDDTATVTFTNYIFLEEGTITPTGSETFHVFPGSVKFNVEVIAALNFD